MRICIPMLSIKPSGVTKYLTYEGDRKSYDKPPTWIDNFKNNQTEGAVSDRAGRRIKQAIDWLLATTPEKKVYDKKRGKSFKFKCSFITLTLASKQRHTDDEIKAQLLNQFFVEARKHWRVQRYVWRAEAQANGNIHFHILCDRFIPWHQLRARWNRIQNKLGYVDRFAVEHGHHDPNSTDIHSVKNVKNLSNYVAKYCTKNVYKMYSKHGVEIWPERVSECVKAAEGQHVTDLKNGTVLADKSAVEFFAEYDIKLVLATRPIIGRLWGISQSLSGLQGLKVVCENAKEAVFNRIAELFPQKIFSGDFFDTVRVKIWEWLPVVDLEFSGTVRNWLRSIQDRWAVGQESFLLT